MDLDNIKSITSSFFEKMMISFDKIEVILEEKNIYYIKINTTDSNILIGQHWKTLEDIRLILKEILSKTLWFSIVLHLEINDYLEQKNDKFLAFINKKIQLLKSNWKEVILENLNSFERKKVHFLVSEMNDPSIFTKSIWEWKDRKLHICKKTLSINSIDIDWVWI